MQTASLKLDGWAVLDEPGEWEAFGRRVAGREGWWESYLAIEGMHCASCVTRIESALAEVEGVEEANVVVAQPAVCGDELQPFSTRLRNEQPVERVDRFCGLFRASGDDHRQPIAPQAIQS